MAIDESIKRNNLLIKLIMFLSFFSLVFYFSICSIASDTAEQDVLHDSQNAYSKIVESLDAQISLLKWIGGAIVGSLVTAVGILWKSNLAKDQTILVEVKSAGSLREQFIQELQAARDMRMNVIASVDGLGRKIEFCPGRREREEADMKMAK